MSDLLKSLKLAVKDYLVAEKKLSDAEIQELMHPKAKSPFWKSLTTDSEISLGIKFLLRVEIWDQKDISEDDLQIEIFNYVNNNWSVRKEDIMRQPKLKNLVFETLAQELMLDVSAIKKEYDEHTSLCVQNGIIPETNIECFGRHIQALLAARMPTELGEIFVRNI